ncbi:MAG: 30S ribosome-binding factor RbfA [Gammaproteobacteria bacterium]
MQKKTYRIERVTELIQMELMSLLRLEASDPRFSKITISNVEISKDISIAKIFFTTQEEDAKALERALNKASKYLRHLLSQRVLLRNTPRLQFYYDKHEARAQRLDFLIESAIKQDHADIDQ